MRIKLIFQRTTSNYYVYAEPATITAPKSAATTGHVYISKRCMPSGPLPSIDIDFPSPPPAAKIDDSSL